MNHLQRWLYAGPLILALQAVLSISSWCRVTGDLEELTSFAPLGHVVSVDAQEDLVAVGVSEVNDTVFDHHAIWLLDASNPRIPPVQSALYPGWSGEDVLICEDLLFALMWTRLNIQPNYVFVVVDISDPRQPLEIGRLGGIDGDRMDLKGSKVYVRSFQADGRVLVIDITNPRSPSLLRDSLCPDDEDVYCSRALGLDVFGANAFAATIIGSTRGTDGLEILDVADPFNPILLSRTNLGSAGLAVQVFDDIAIVLTEADHGTLHVIDVSDPTDPRVINSHLSITGANKVILFQGHAYVAAAGFYIVDIKDPHNPKIVASDTNTEFAHDVAVSGTSVFVADDDLGLVIMRFGRECIHSATLELSCAGEVVPSTEELRLRIHAGPADVSGCEPVPMSGGTILAECAIDLSSFLSATPPSCSVLTQTLTGVMADCLLTQATGTLTFTRVGDASIVIESESPFHVTVCGNDFGLLSVQSSPCPGPYAGCDTEDIPTRTPTPTFAFTPTASPTRTQKPCPPYDFHQDCRIDARDLLILFGQLLERASENELLDFSLYWHEVGEEL